MVEQAAIAGSAANGIYSQTYTTGNFFIVLSLSGSEAVNKELGRNTLTKIEEIATQTPNIAPKEIVEIISDEFKNGIKIDLAIAKISGQKLSLSSVGQVSAKLIRQGKMINLLGIPATSHQPASPSQGGPPVSSISGPVLHNDLLVIATNEFFPLLSTDDLVGHESQSVVEIRDVLLPKVEALGDNSKIAALLVSVDLVSNPPEETSVEEASEDQPLSPTPPTVGHSYSLGPLVNQFKDKYQSLRKIASPHGLYLKNHYDGGPPTSRRTVYLAIVVFISLVCLVAFQLRSRSIELSAKTVAAMEKQVQDSIDSAQKLAGVNDAIAREVLLQSRQDFVSKAEATFGQNWQKTDNGKLKAILANLDTKITLISHIYNVADLNVFYDFGLLKSGVKIVSAGLEKNEIFALDNANGAAYSVGTKNKTAAILIGSEDLKSGKLIDGIEDSVYVLTGSGILKIDLSTQPTSTKQVIKASDKWGEIRGAKTFGGNLYLLDAANNQVWKYQGTDLGFADIAPYLKAESVDFSKVTGMAIDGYIYVLSASGNVVRFASGYGDDSFRLTGLPEPLSNPSSIFASDETENIYVLDNNSRVIVLDKKGAYLAEHVLPSSSPLAVSSLLVDESVKKVFLVSGDKVFSFDLH